MKLTFGWGLNAGFPIAVFPVVEGKTHFFACIKLFTDQLRSSSVEERLCHRSRFHFHGLGLVHARTISGKAG